MRVARGSPKNTRKSKKGEVDTDSEHSSLHSSDIDPSDTEPSDYIPRGRREEIRATRRRSSKDDASRTATLYAFSPARHGSWSASAQDHRSAGKPSPEENEDYSSSKRGERPQKPGKVSEIYESRYTCIDNISDSERNGIAEILARVRRSYVKSIQTSIDNYVQYMEPGYLQRSLHPDGNTKVAPLIPYQEVSIGFPCHTSPSSHTQVCYLPAVPVYIPFKHYFNLNYHELRGTEICNKQSAKIRASLQDYAFILLSSGVLSSTTVSVAGESR